MLSKTLHEPMQDSSPGFVVKGPVRAPASPVGVRHAAERSRQLSPEFTHGFRGVCLRLRAAQGGGAWLAAPARTASG